MNKLTNYIKNSVLIKIASLNSFSVFVRIICGVLTSKAIAVFVGVEGMALIGNLRNFVSTITSFSNLGFSKGIVKYVSEFKDDKSELKKIISTSFYTVFVALIVLIIALYFNNQALEKYLFRTEGLYSKILALLPILVPLYALNTILLSIINGLFKFKRHIVINISSQLLALGITLFLVWNNQLQGALLAVVLIPAAILLVTLFYSRKDLKLLPKIDLANFEFKYLKKLSSFSIMALFSAVLVPIVFIQIRNLIMDYDSMQGAGCWEAMQRISTYYLMFATSLVSLYLLPKFSVIKLSSEFRTVVWDFYKTIIPVFFIALVLIYFFREFIIRFLFTEEFLPTTNLFFWQLAGDFIKVLSIVISFQLFAKKMVWQYLVVETIALLNLYFLSEYFIELYGAKGATMAHFITFSIHFVIILFIFRKILFSRQTIKI